MDWRAYALLAAGVLVLASVMPGPTEKVVFLDVGQGDAILLQDGAAQILIDGGKGMAVLQRLAEELPYYDRRIDVIVASHPDQDHLEGLVHVLERYEVGLVLLPQVPHTSALQHAWLERLQEAAERRGVAWRFAWAGQQVRAGDLVVNVLGPTPEIAAAAGRGKTNNASVIMRVDFCEGDENPSQPPLQRGGGCLSFLLTGDAEGVVERRLAARYAGVMSTSPPPPLLRQGEGSVNGSTSPSHVLNVDILKAGHHGSKTSTTAELLRAASPAAVIVSVGAENRYGHPHPTVLERLRDVRVWRTDEHGSVRFVRGRGGWMVQVENSNQ